MSELTLDNLLGAYGESQFGGVTGFVLNIVGFQSFGSSIVDNFWFGIWGIMLIFIGGIALGWFGDVAEESGIEASAKWGVVIAVMFAIMAIGALVHLPNGFFIPYVIVVAYAWNEHRKNSAGLYAIIAVFGITMIGTWIAPGFFDFFGYANWRNYQDWIMGTNYGPGIRDTWWVALPDWIEDLVGGAAGQVGLRTGRVGTDILSITPHSSFVGQGTDLSPGGIWEDFTQIPETPETAGYHWYDYILPEALWPPERWVPRFWRDVAGFMWFWSNIVFTGLAILFVLIAVAFFTQRARKKTHDWRPVVVASVGGVVWLLFLSIHTYTLVRGGFWLPVAIGGLWAGMTILGWRMDAKRGRGNMGIILFAIFLWIYYLVVTYAILDLVYLRTFNFADSFWWLW